MNPDHPVLSGKGSFQSAKNPLPAFHPFPGLGIEGGGDVDTGTQEKQENVVYDYAQIVVISLTISRKRKCKVNIGNYPYFTIFATL